MTATVVYSDYNPYPGLPPGSALYSASAGRFVNTTTGFNFTTGREPPLLPAVNLLNSFNFGLYGKSGTTTPSTLRSGVDVDVSFATTGVRKASGSARVPSFGATDDADPEGYFRVYKKPTSMAWIKTGGPQGNGICRNERGDWFTEEALSTADSTGNGIYLETVPAATPTTSLVIGYSTVSSGKAGGSSTSVPISATVPNWNSLRIRGSYNAAVFCYNDFAYTNNNDGKVYTARSLFEMPDRIDNIVRFVPDERSTTTLTFFIRINWELRFYNPYNISTSSITSSIGSTGTDIHEITHVINNTNPNWSSLLQQIIRDRQRSLAEQDARYGNTFPGQTLTVAPKPEI